MKRFPEEGKNEKSGNADYIIPEGESRQQVLDRSKEFLDDIILKHQGKSILAVTHGGIVSSIVRLVLNIPINAPRRFYLPNTAINVFEFNGTEWFVKTLGEISFLDSEDLSDGIQ